VYVHILVFYVHVYPLIGLTVYLALLATSQDDVDRWDGDLKLTVDWSVSYPGPILSVFPALIVHSELKSVHPGFPVAFIF